MCPLWGFSLCVTIIIGIILIKVIIRCFFYIITQFFLDRIPVSSPLGVIIVLIHNRYQHIVI